MNKLLVVLIAGAFASVAAAQTQPPKPTKEERRQDVQSATQAGSGSSASTQKTAAEQAANVKASQEISKMTKEEKRAFFDQLRKENINPNNPSGSVAGTAAMQKATTAESKMVPKQNTQIKTKEGQKALSKELQQKASP